MNQASNLGRASGANGMPLSQETSVDVNGDFASQVGLLFLSEFATLAALAEAQVFVVDDLCDREAVVHFGHVYVFRRYASHLISLLCRFDAARERRE